jgi:hypothetical protein
MKIIFINYLKKKAKKEEAIKNAQLNMVKRELQIL